MAAHLHTFSRASRPLYLSASSFEWTTGLLVSFVTGKTDFDFGFTTLKSSLPQEMVWEKIYSRSGKTESGNFILSL